MNEKNIFKRLLYRINRECYGFDDLNRYLIYGALGTMVINILINSNLIAFIGYTLDVLFLIRFFSKKKFKRSEENRVFRKYQKYYTEKWKARKTHRIFMCKKCGQLIRVPKGLGELVVTCPNCKDKTDRYS